MAAQPVEKPALSIIVPAYNAERTIGRCLDSLRAQTLQDIEIIVVDDCSSDGTAVCAEEAAAADPCIQVIRNPQNLKTGPTRNAGIEAARGEYVGFVDSDDWVSPEYFAELYETACAGQFDIVTGCVVRVIETADGNVSSAEPINDVHELAHELAEGTPFIDCVYVDHCGSIYARTLLENNPVRYGNARNAEDTQFMLLARYYAKSYGVCTEAQGFYCYAMREGSATQHVDSKRFEEELASAREQIGFMRAHTIDEGIGYRRTADIITALLLLAVQMDDKRTAKQEIRALIEGIPDKRKLAAHGRRIFAFIYGNVLL